NKVRHLAPVVGVWQGVTRLVEGQEIARRAPGATVLVQVEVAGRTDRQGVAPPEVGDLVASLRRLDLDVAGLMAVGPPGPPEGARPGFHLLADLAGQLGLGEVSMGMSDDLEVAVGEGATMVRIGRALFGDRPAAGAPCRDQKLRQ
ncbi:MAG: alanine racemase, partial [Acidimicrobiales bacterium]